MSNKLVYLSKAFSRAQNKKYEHYVVSAIYNRINNYELKPVTQQKVVSSKDPTKYYFLDLYFPQINYGVEVDEQHHTREYHAINDIKRADDIFKKINCRERRITIPEDEDLESVNKQIEEVVKEVKQKIADKQKLDGTPLQWIDNEVLRETALNNRAIEVGDGIDYKNITSIWNAIKGNSRKNLRRCYQKLEDDCYLWVPKLTIVVNGIRIGDPKWTNELVNNGDYIVESGQRKQALVKGKVTAGEKRVTFMQTRDELGTRCVQFIGVFQHIENKDANTAVYKKITNKYTW